MRFRGFWRSSSALWLAGVQASALLFLASASPAAGETAVPCPGVEVVRVAEGSNAQQIGLRTADRLHSWRFLDPAANGRVGPSGPICSPFDLYRLTLEIQPRSEVELLFERGGDTIRMPAKVRSGATFLPVLDDSLRRLWDEAKGQRHDVEGEAPWQALLRAGEAQGLAVVDRVWIMVERGFGLATHGHPEEGDRWMARAHALAELEEPWIAAHIQRSRGQALGQRHPASVPFFEAARQGWLDLGAELSAAHAAELLGLGALQRFELESAEHHLLEVEKIRARLAPGSWFQANTNANLGVLYFHRGDREKAVERLQRTLAILEDHSPSKLLADSHANLAALHGLGGETAEQVTMARQALRWVRGLKLGAGSESNALLNLSQAYVHLGDLSQAESLAREAVAPAETLRDPERLGQVHQNLGWIAELRGDLDAAEIAHRRAIEVHRASGTNTPEEAVANISLGQVLILQGRYDVAEETFQDASRHLAEHAPDHYSRVDLESTWAELLLARGLPEEALRKADAAIARAEDAGFGGERLFLPRLARSRSLIALEQLDAAATAAAATLALTRRFAPGTAKEVQALGVSATVAARRGDWRQAATTFCSAVDLLEGQIDRLGGTMDSAARFRSRYLDVFVGCAEARLQLGEAAEAFHVLERSRAWRVRRALAERGLLAKGQGDLDRRLRRLAAEHDRVLQQLAEATTEDPSESAILASTRSRLQALAVEREALWSEARAADPRFARLAYPRPLTAEQAARHLRPSERLVLFEVADSSTLVVTVEPTGRTRGYRLPLSEEDLRAKVNTFLSEIAARSEASVLHPLAEELWNHLVAPLGPVPLRQSSDPSTQWIVSADGPLLRLPWSALGRFTQPGLWRWAIEDLSVTVVPSATVWAELVDRPTARGRRIAAFGDPTPAGATSPRPAAAALRSLLAQRGALEPLPGSRSEVQAIGRVFRQRPLDLFVGADATEGNARGLGSAQRIVHFAGHALVDEVNPLESGLVLASPEDPEAGVDNGFLQAWEILDSVRLDADLVTLSACSTARGAEQAGEGTLDLASAFLHVGARSVVASLWPVSDHSTAELMTEFYRALAAGTSRHEALRRAQLTLLQRQRRGEATHDGAQRGIGGLTPRDGKAPAGATVPFYWAAFRLVGDPG